MYESIYFIFTAYLKACIKKGSALNRIPWMGSAKFMHGKLPYVGSSPTSRTIYAGVAELV